MPSMVNWGILEKIMQNAVQKCCWPWVNRTFLRYWHIFLEGIEAKEKLGLPILNCNCTTCDGWEKSAQCFNATIPHSIRISVQRHHHQWHIFPLILYSWEGSIIIIIEQPALSTFVLLHIGENKPPLEHSHPPMVVPLGWRGWLLLWWWWRLLWWWE